MHIVALRFIFSLYIYRALYTKKKFDDTLEMCAQTWNRIILRRRKNNKSSTLKTQSQTPRAGSNEHAVFTVYCHSLTLYNSCMSANMANCILLLTFCIACCLFVYLLAGSVSLVLILAPLLPSSTWPQNHYASTAISNCIVVIRFSIFLLFAIVPNIWLAIFQLIERTFESKISHLRRKCTLHWMQTRCKYREKMR